MMRTVFQCSDSCQLTILMMSLELSLGVFLTQLSVVHVQNSLEIFRMILVSIAKGR